ncbi:uncharacterized protein BXZ73DRAFT_80888 [Epithele typhae]|uniref:uncharacterized protein n=1 Tax=Epithele typhae TaxID=378194 RepID=UPI0020081B38|nr:uncharacterized protein BXZ73DRAFT_80888 [Epithele typhae]KAH9917128.1 hypothetical protein BXZ73DRAFT_80888 [Epithele typhae]
MAAFQCSALNIDHHNGDFTIWELGAIILYLMDKYGLKEGKLSPVQDDECGRGYCLHPEKLPSAIIRYENEVIRVFGMLKSVLSNRLSRCASEGVGPVLVGVENGPETHGGFDAAVASRFGLLLFQTRARAGVRAYWTLPATATIPQVVHAVFSVPSGKPTPQTPFGRNRAGDDGKKRKSRRTTGSQRASRPHISRHIASGSVSQSFTPRSVSNKSEHAAKSLSTMLNLVVYITSLVRFSFTSEPEWSDKDGFWDVHDFVLKFTRTAQTRRKQQKAKTTTWWIHWLTPSITGACFGNVALTVDKECTPFDDILNTGSNEEVPEGGNDGDGDGSAL